MSANDDYPGRKLTDAQRSPRGLGWEYARRGWDRSRCPLRGVEARLEFAWGYDHFVCTDPKVDAAMLRRGVPMDGP
jgi:hypothetical protein